MDVKIKIPALEKLLDYVASGIGSVAGPMLAPWRARRKAEAKVIAAQAEAKEQKILSAGQATTVQLIAKAQADARSTLLAPNAKIHGELIFDDLVSQRIQFQEEKRQTNIGSVVRHAASTLGDGEVNNHRVDHDWTARFFDHVQDVSSEDMQRLWAKVLAGEVKRPNSTSIQTLNILRNLDRETAKIFSTLCSACISIQTEDQFLDIRVASMGGNAATNALDKYGLNFDKLNILNEHGLIISDYNSWFDYNPCIEPWPSKAQVGMWFVPFYFQDKFWVLSPTTERDPNEEFRVSGVALTRSGRELSRIVDLEPMVTYGQSLLEFSGKKDLRMKEVKDCRPLTIV